MAAPPLIKGATIVTNYCATDKLFIIKIFLDISMSTKDMKIQPSVRILSLNRFRVSNPLSARSNSFLNFSGSAPGSLLLLFKLINKIIADKFKLTVQSNHSVMMI